MILCAHGARLFCSDTHGTALHPHTHKTPTSARSSAWVLREREDEVPGVRGGAACLRVRQKGFPIVKHVLAEQWRGWVGRIVVHSTANRGGAPFLPAERPSCCDQEVCVCMRVVYDTVE